MVRPATTTEISEQRQLSRHERIDRLFARQRAESGHLHISRSQTCAGYEGSYQHEQQDARLFAMWASISKIRFVLICRATKRKSSPGRSEEAVCPDGIDTQSARSGYGVQPLRIWTRRRLGVGPRSGGNYWRTTDDVGSGIDGSLWKSMDAYGFGEAAKRNGRVREAGTIPIMFFSARFVERQNSSYTSHARRAIYVDDFVEHVRRSSDPGKRSYEIRCFTLTLLTNDEVIAVNQDALGKQAIPLVRKDGIEIWEKDMEDGSKAIALFNRGSSSAPARLERSVLGPGKWRIRDLWSHKNLVSCSRRLNRACPLTA